MKIPYKKIAIVLTALAAAIQLIPTTQNTSNVVLETTFTKVFDVPSEIAQQLKSSCYDCHSNNTRYPWYSHLQPMALMMSDHITEGKDELNFSEFGSYSKRRQKNKLKSIASQISDDNMPLASYTLIHRDAVLSQEQAEQIVAWVDSRVDEY